MDKLLIATLKKDYATFSELFGASLEESLNQGLDEKLGLNEKGNDDNEYKVFFQKALKKYKVKDPSELKGAKKKEFFDFVDKNWDAGENETD